MKNSRCKPSKPLHLRDGGGTEPLTRWAENGALRTGHGGVVPGGGKGDKIPAKYEPGEFVVSNDMQDAAPGLREQLAELRGGVLAAKGMTPEQADARALHGGGLRAAAGFDGSVAPTFGSGSQANQSLLEAARQHATPVQAVAGNAPMGSPDGVATKVPSSMTTRELFSQPPSGIPNNPNGPLKLPTPVGAQPAPAVPVQSLRSSVTSAIKSAGPAVAAGVAGGMVANAARGIGNPAGTPGVPAQEDPLVAQIPKDGYAPTPAAQPYNFFTDNETGRNLGNLASAASMIPGVGPAISSLRLGAAAAGRAARAAPVAAAAVMGIGEGVRGGRETTTAGPAPAPAPLRSSGDAMMSGQDAMMSGQDAMMPGQDPGWLNGDGANRVKVTRQANGVMEFSGKDIGQNGGDISYSDNRASTPRVSTVPGMSQADIDGVLNNPDGSRWSGNDNAIMAANMRDGIDPYRGTSRGGSSQVSIMPDTGGYGLRDKAYLERREAAMPLKSSLASKEQKAEASAQLARFDDRDIKNAENAIARRGQDLARATTLRGQDITERDNIRNNDTSLRNSMAKNKLAVFNAQREQSNADRTHALAAGTQTQALGEKYRENARKEFTVFGEDRKPDEAASKQAFDTVRQIFPGIESADEGIRNKVMPDAKEMHGIFENARKNDKVGWDAMKFWEAKRPALSGMPDARGGKTEQMGFLGGALTLGADNGETLLRRPDGTSLNLGKLTARQRELLEKAKQTGWGS